MAGTGAVAGTRRRAAALLLAAALALALALLAAVLMLKVRLDQSRQQIERADAARGDGVIALVAARQADGAFAAAASLAASEPRVPRSFKDNAELARYETATLLDSARLSLGRGLDVEWLQAAAGTRPVLVSWGWSSGVSTLEVGARPAITDCGLMPGAPRIRLAPDGRWFGMLNLSTHESALRLAPACTQDDPLLTAWSTYIARQESRGAHLSTQLPLSGPALLLGWADGRVEMLRTPQAPLTVMRFDAAAVGLIPNNAATAFALLSRDGRLELVDASGRSLAPALTLQRDVPASTREAAWLAFLRDAALPSAGALLLDQGALDARASAVLGIASKPESATLLLHDLPADGAPVFDVAVAIAPNDGCAFLEVLHARTLASLAMDPACAAAQGARAQAIDLPGAWASSTEASRGFSAGAFCDGGSTIVLGSTHGELLWMRHLQAFAGAGSRIDVEHAERSGWDDPVTALVCREDGSVHAGFQSAGIKAFRPRLRLQQRVVGVRSIKAYADVVSEDQVWSVETRHGAARLEFVADEGELRLLRQGLTQWRRQPAEPAPPRPQPASDKVIAVVLDALRSRVWVLTTMGRLSLLDLETGAVLARFSTAFYAAAPNKEVALERPQLDASGQLSFVHRFRDLAMRVVIEEGNR